MKIGKDLQFNVIFRPEKAGGFTVIVPSLPGCISYGKTLSEAKKMIVDAIEGYIASMKKHNEIIETDYGNFISVIDLANRKSYA